MSDLRHTMTQTRAGLASLSWLLVEWDCSGQGEAWFSELLRKYNARAARLLEKRASQPSKGSP